ncbi:protein EARLY FLOWERING 3-like [Rutidosis leptorrhynchoides]|uniref:protein EARLY FLOWERING 3-like n=1 Tax=Rutidosis leptorrhynchoides TaxID=125765 RepID=UPI003A99B1A2
MKRGKDEDKKMGPMFPRLHVNDTEKGGPRAPPRNKMALYEQLSIPSQWFNGGVPSSSTAGAMNERGTFSPCQQSSTVHPTRKADTRHSDFNNHQRVQQENHTTEEEDDFRVPIFDQQSGTSQNHSKKRQQNRENGSSVTPFGAHFLGRLAHVQPAKQNNNNKIQKENSFARSDASNQSTRPIINAPFKETNESSHINGLSNNNVNTRDYRADSQADNTLWGDSVVNEASKGSGYANNSVPLRDVQEHALRSPNDPATTNADAVSETSMVDSVCGVDISPDDVVGIIGQKHFWKARRAIVNQQRVFAVQVFELHRLIKVQRLIAGSPQLLVDESAYVAKPAKVSPIKKLPIEYVLKSSLNTPNQKINAEKPNDDTEFSAENAVGKASLSSVQNGSQTTNCRPFGGPPSDPNMGSWNFNGPPGHQWLIPVMTPSEGLVYKPYPGPGFMGPAYGGCGPPGSMPPIIGHNFPNYGIPPSDHHRHYEGGPTGVHPFAPCPPPSHGYFPAYGMQRASPPVSSSTRFEPSNPNPNPNPNPFNLQRQGSSNVPIEKKGSAVPNPVKFKPYKDNEVQASTASSRSDKTKDRNALPLFPTSTPTPTPVPEPAQVETVGPPRVIRVVPHNARSATASVARIFRSIQEERMQYDEG